MTIATGKTFLPKNPAPVAEKQEVKKPAKKEAKSEVPKKEASKE